MKYIGAALANGLNYQTAGAAGFRGIVIHCDVNFLHRVGIRRDVENAGIRVAVRERVIHIERIAFTALAATVSLGRIDQSEDVIIEVVAGSQTSSSYSGH